MIANAGRLKSVERPLLIFVSSFVSTAESLVSLPAAASVNTTPTGRDFFTVCFLDQNSQISVSGFAVPCATAFEVSITLPPPTANTKSVPNSMDFFTASLANESLGFGFTPPTVIYSRPASSNEAVTSSSNPLLTTLPPP